MLKKLLAADFLEQSKFKLVGQTGETAATAWWVSSEAAKAGIYLHSLVVARPGHFAESQFDSEARVLRSYFGTEVFTMDVLEVWAVVEDDVRFVTMRQKLLLKEMADDDVIRAVTMNLSSVVACPFEDYSRLRIRRFGSIVQCEASELLARFGIDDHASVRMITMVEPLAALMGRGFWSTLAVPQKCALPWKRLALAWGKAGSATSWPSSFALEHKTDPRPLDKTCVAIAAVDQYLLQRSRNGDEEASDALIHFRAMSNEFEPFSAHPDAFRNTSASAEIRGGYGYGWMRTKVRHILAWVGCGPRAAKHVAWRDVLGRRMRWVDGEQWRGGMTAGWEMGNGGMGG